MNPLHGPPADVQQAPVRCQSCTVAVVVPQPAASTVTSCRAFPVEASSDARFDGHAVTEAAGPAEAAAGRGRLVEVVGATDVEGARVVGVTATVDVGAAVDGVTAVLATEGDDEVVLGAAARVLARLVGVPLPEQADTIPTTAAATTIFLGSMNAA